MSQGFVIYNKKKKEGRKERKKEKRERERERERVRKRSVVWPFVFIGARPVAARPAA